jgi:AraC-like DNA-binding protein
MSEEPRVIVQRWSTAEVCAARRLDHFAGAISSSVDPMRLVSRGSGAFSADVSTAQLGPLTIIRASGNAHRCLRGESEIARTSERSIHLRFSSIPWALKLRSDVGVDAGDGLLVDSVRPFELDVGDFKAMHVKVPYAWLQQWIVSPATLSGTIVRRDRGWGSVLAAFVAQLTPEWAASAPMPTHLLADQFGALLAMAAGESSGTTPPARSAQLVRYERVVDCIRQRCTEHSLQAVDVASSLDVSLRSLHRSLAASSVTFGALLIRARLDVAVRMLESPRFARLTSGEIGRRAGFADASHFARVVRAAHGRTPGEMRPHRSSD